jgi:hypothetical protein
MNSRRDFFQDVACLAALAALVEESGDAQVKDEKVSDFWDAYFDEALGVKKEDTRKSSESPLIDPNRQVQLIYATPDGLRYPDTIGESELRSDAKDVVVTFNPGHFRPAPDDYKAIARTKSSQVRVDWFQKQPIMNFLAPMAWVGLASWSMATMKYDPQKKKDTVTKGLPPSLQELDFRDPNAPNAPIRNEVVLPGGSGQLAINVRAVKLNQRLHTVLDRTVRYSSIVSPFFGFAPLAIPALKAFTDLLGAVFSHEFVVMNTLPVQVLATQEAAKGPHNTGGVRIVGGDFIAVPANQTSELKSDFDKLRVEDGWLVHQDSSKNQRLEDRAKDDRIPPVSYVSLNLHIEPVEEVIRRKGSGA